VSYRQLCKASKNDIIRKTLIRGNNAKIKQIKLSPHYKHYKSDEVRIDSYQERKPKLEIPPSYQVFLIRMTAPKQEKAAPELDSNSLPRKQGKPRPNTQCGEKCVNYTNLPSKVLAIPPLSLH